MPAGTPVVSAPRPRRWWPLRWSRRARPPRWTVYTAIYGGYDTLKPHPDVPDTDWICFTDDPGLRGNGWTVIVGERRSECPRLDSRLFKWRPDLVLPGRRYTLWVDGVQIYRTPRVVEEAFACLRDGIAMWRHPDRDCIYAEAEVATPMPKYAGQDLRAQVAHYRAAYGYPRHGGLWANTVIARDSAAPRIARLGAFVLAECERWGSTMDQLPSPVGLRQLGIRCGEFPETLWANSWFERGVHADGT